MRGAAGGERAQGQGTPQEVGTSPRSKESPPSWGEAQGPGCEGCTWHLQVQHQGEALQEPVIVRLEGVGPPQVLDSRGVVAELDVGFGS